MGEKKKPKKILTPKQEAFCQAYVKSTDENGKPIGISAAYRSAYNCKTANDNTVTRKAFALKSTPAVAARIEELRAPVIEKIQASFEDHLAELARLRDEARENGQFSAAITAEVNRGRALGYYVERSKTELTGANGAPLNAGPIEVKFVDPAPANDTE